MMSFTCFKAAVFSTYRSSTRAVSTKEYFEKSLWNWMPQNQVGIMRLTGTETLSVTCLIFWPDAWAEHFCSPTMRIIDCGQSLHCQMCAKLSKVALFSNEKERKMCCLLMIKLITVPVCYGRSTTFYISPCLQESCCYVHCYQQTHHSSVNTLSHLWVLLEFNLCSSQPRAVCQALITKTMHLFCWVCEQL